MSKTVIIVVVEFHQKIKIQNCRNELTIVTTQMVQILLKVFLLLTVEVANDI